MAQWKYFITKDGPLPIYHEDPTRFSQCVGMWINIWTYKFSKKILVNHGLG